MTLYEMLESRLPHKKDINNGYRGIEKQKGYNQALSEVKEILRKVELDEKLAEYAHNSWSGWISYMFSKMERQSNGDWWIPKWAYERWIRQSQTEYKNLPEEEKESDREEAKNIISILKGIENDETE